MSSEITRVGVVVPAHNEERLLADSLFAIQRAARLVALPVDILVVLDDCNDGSRDRCREAGVNSLAIRARNVGIARAVGFEALIGEGTVPSTVWLASTDADTRVEPTWLRHQLELAHRGADVVLGLVRLDGHAASHELRQAFDLDYQTQLFDDGSHNHVHGANLGLRASAHLRAGGFPRRPTTKTDTSSSDSSAPPESSSNTPSSSSSPPAHASTADATMGSLPTSPPSTPPPDP